MGESLDHEVFHDPRQSSRHLVPDPFNPGGLLHRDRPDVVARRSFLASLAPLAAFLGYRRASPHWEPAGRGDRPLPDTWDLSWLNQLRGKHRQVFDLSNMEIGLVVVRNWFDAHQAVYGLKYPDL